MNEHSSTLTREQKLKIVNIFVQTNDRKKTAKMCKVHPTVVDDVAIEYYGILNDLVHDKQITDKIVANYDDALESCTSIINTSLKIYQQQVNNIDKIYGGSNKLIPDYLIREIGSILQYTMPLLQSQLTMAQQNKFNYNKMNVDLQKLEVQYEETNNEEEFNDNVAKIAEFVSDSLIYPQNVEQAKRVKVTYLQENDEDGTPKQMIFPSIACCSKELGVPRSSMTKYIDEKRPYKETYLFELCN